MVGLTLFVGVCVAAFAWKKLKTRAGIGRALLIPLSLAVVAAQWSLLVAAARLPRRMTPLENDASVVYSVIAATDDYALLSGPQAVQRVTLPSGEVTARYPMHPDLIHIHDAVVHEDHVLVAHMTQEGDRYHDGLVLIGPEGYVIPPGELTLDASERGQEVANLSWDGERGAFVVYTQQRSTRSKDALVLRTRTVSLAGTVLELEPCELSLAGADLPRSLSGAAISPGPGGLWYLSEGRGWRIRQSEAGATLEPESVRLDPGVRLMSASRYDPNVGLTRATHALTPEGPRSLGRPQDAAFAGSFFPSEHGGEARWNANWVRENLESVLWIGERALYVNQFSSGRAPRGVLAVDRGTLLEQRDATGLPTARFVASHFSPASLFVFRSGSELVWLDAQLKQRARLRADTLERLDPPSAVVAVRDRLRVWGGRSLLFEFALCLSLIGTSSLLPVFALALRRDTATFGLRFLLCYAVAALPTALWTAEKLFFL